MSSFHIWLNLWIEIFSFGAICKLDIDTAAPFKQNIDTAVLCRAIFKQDNDIAVFSRPEHCEQDIDTAVFSRLNNL